MTQALAIAVAERDGALRGHGDEVEDLATGVARRLGLSDVRGRRGAARRAAPRRRQARDPRPHPRQAAARSTTPSGSSSAATRSSASASSRARPRCATWRCSSAPATSASTAPATRTACAGDDIAGRRPDHRGCDAFDAMTRSRARTGRLAPPRRRADGAAPRRGHAVRSRRSSGVRSRRIADVARRGRRGSRPRRRSRLPCAVDRDREVAAARDARLGEQQRRVRRRRDELRPRPRPPSATPRSARCRSTARPAGAPSAPRQRSAPSPRRTAPPGRPAELGGRRSIPLAASTAAAASRIPQPSSGDQPVPGARRAVRLRRRRMSPTLQVGVQAAHERRRRGHLRRRHRRARQVRVARVAVVGRAASAAAGRPSRPLEDRASSPGTRPAGPGAPRSRRPRRTRPARSGCRARRTARAQSPDVAAVTVSPLPAERSGPVPRGCSRFAGAPCSRPGRSAAAATSTTPRPVGEVDRVDAASRAGRRRPSIPKLMLMASAPRSTGVDDRGGDRRVREIRLLDDEPAAQPGARDPQAVAGHGAGDRGDVGPVAVLVDGRRAVVGVRVLVDGGAQLRRDLRMRRRRRRCRSRRRSLPRRR